MMLTYILLFITFCGLLGVFLRRNFLNVSISLLQVAIGINALSAELTTNTEQVTFIIYLTAILIFTFILFLNAVAILLIKRRSTINVNELTELRG